MHKQRTETYAQTIRHDNYIVRDHRVHGIRTLPGVALLDMICRLAEKHLGTRVLELREILFRQPVVTSESFDCQVFITFTPEQDKWKVKVSSSKLTVNEAADHESMDNMECFLYTGEAGGAPRKPDIAAIIEGAAAKWDMDEVYGLARKSDITHMQFMKTEGTVYQRGNEELMELRLSRLAERFRDKFTAHPAFLDGSTFAGSSMRLSGKEREAFKDYPPYIPFMLRRFRVYRELPQQIYTYSQHASFEEKQEGPPDIVTTDISIYNRSGDLLVEMEGLVAKRIRDRGLIQKLVTGEPKPSSADTAAALAAPSAEELAASQAKLMQAAVEASSQLSEPAELDSRIRTLLTEEVAAVLKVPASRIEADAGFYNLGLDSAQLLGLVKRLEQLVHEQLYPTLLFEYSTINLLTAYMLEHYPGAFEGGTRHAATAREAGHAGSFEQASEDELLTFIPQWVRQERTAPAKSGLEFAKRIIVLHESHDELEAALRQAFGSAIVVVLPEGGPAHAERFEQKCRSLLHLIQAYMGQPEGLFLQLLADDESVYADALAGLLKTAHAEQSRVSSQLIRVEALEEMISQEVVQLLEQEWHASHAGAEMVRFQRSSRSRYVRRWIGVSVPEQAPSVDYRPNGVYVITGGLGGLGLSVAEHIAASVPARIALIGRTAPGAEQRLRMERMIQQGAEVEFVRADVSQASEVNEAVGLIKGMWGFITGVFHCAGVVKDAWIMNKQAEDLVQVLRPKTFGTMYLDEALREERLDFFLMFSSVSAVLGNLGQADYACANAFMDQYAKERQHLVSQGLRHGQTKVINWPLWSEGGMLVDGQSVAMMKELSGMKPLPTAAGLSMMDAVLRGKQEQVIVLYGDERAIRRFAAPHLSQAAPEAKQPQETVPSDQKRKASVPAEAQRSTSGDPRDIVVIGLAGRYPQADTIEQYYENLKSGKDCISEVPKLRWADSGLSYDVEDIYRYGGFLDQIDQFDPLFFNMSPRQAEMLDPQARLFLQTAWEACEDAGFYLNRTEHYYSASGKSVGVFAGVFWNHYELFAAEQTARGIPMSFGTSPASIPNMVSYCLNLHGPSMAVDTMCSSSLTAVHLASDSIRKGECSYAIAGGVNLVTHPHRYMFLKQAEFLSTDGKCRSFGQDGDGYVPGEGVGAVLLTTREEAEKEGFHIYGVIKGSALNHVGKTNGAMVPDPVAQSEVIADALTKAGVDPRTISYIEAHGTGTSLGDPIEIQGLQRAFSRSTKDKQFCAIGSSKSNMGHLEAAAGIGGLTKLLLQLKHKQIFPTLHAEVLNPHIPFEHSPFFVARECMVWERPQVSGRNEIIPLRAGISSFGANGSNAHIVVEEYIQPAIPAKRTGSTAAGRVVVPLSARTEEQLLEYAGKLLTFLRNGQSREAGGNLHQQAGEKVLELYIVHAAAGLMGVSPDSLGESLEDWTLDHVHMHTLCLKLEEQFGLAVEPDLLRNSATLAALVEQLSAKLEYKPGLGAESGWARGVLEQVAYTLQAGREPMNWRAAFVAQSMEELEVKLEAFIQGEWTANGIYTADCRKWKDAVQLLGKDQDAAEVSGRWISTGRLEKVAEWWSKGFYVDWKLLYPEGAPLKISLPTYPFAKERYWVPQSGMLAAAGVKTPVRDEPRQLEEELHAVLTYKEYWRKEDRIHDIRGAAEKQAPAVIVCIVSDEGLRQKAAAAMKSGLGVRELLFLNGKGFTEGLSRIYAEYSRVDAIVDMRAYESRGSAQMPVDYTDIMHFIQDLTASGLKTGRIIWAAPYREHTLEACTYDAWIGFSKSLGMVIPGTPAAVMLSAVEGASQDGFDNMLIHLCNELRSGSLTNVMYKQDGRYVLDYTPVTLPAAQPVLRHGGTYWITGGCGGLGYLFAQELARTWKANLILTGRSPVQAEKEQQLQSLRDQGAQVIYLQADVGHVEDMKRVVREAKLKFGQIDGVLHAAGIEAGGTVLDQDEQQFELVAAPKVKGTLMMDQALQGEQLDFICYFSSSSAMLGDFGACSYAVANRFQTAYAAYRNQAGPSQGYYGKAMAINWPLWKEGGMSADDSASLMYLKLSGQRYLEAQEGIELWGRLLASPDHQVLVLAGLPSRIERFLHGSKPVSNFGPNGHASPPAPEKASKAHVRMESIPLAQRVREDLREQVGGLVKLASEQVDDEEPFADYGLDSVSLSELASLLTTRYGVEITPALLYGYSTVGKLAEYLAGQHAAELVDLYAVQAQSIESLRLPTGQGRKESVVREEFDHSPSKEGEGHINGLEPIAIIGMSGRFPGADNTEELWQLMVSGQSSIRETPVDRWDWRQFAGSRTDGSATAGARWGGFMSDIACFDSLFFEISPSEAEQMDPQQRVFLEEAWHTLEDAGYMGERIRGTSCGVYVGVEESQYGYVTGGGGQVTGNQNATLAARIAYMLDLKGPNMAITAACSSGLAAVHQACQALRHGDCDTALAGGISLLVSPITHLGLGQAGMLSPDGVCRVFDAASSGLVPGEAAAVVMLKPLSRAIQDGDRIHGVIQGSGINYDGKTNGITAPSPISQAALIEQTYAKHGIDAGRIQLILAHSVGSPVGDAIEVQALKETYSKLSVPRGNCRISSVKPLLGHTFAASGVVSLIAMLLAMKHRTMPGLGMYEAANPAIKCDDTAFMINAANHPWQASGNVPRMGAISTTGISGTNVHLVVAEYADVMSKGRFGDRGVECGLFVLSAKTEERLKMYAGELLRMMQMKEKDSFSLRDAAFTLQTGREAMEYRLALTAVSREELLDKLASFLKDGSATGVRTARYVRRSATAPDGKLQQPLIHASREPDRQQWEDIAGMWLEGAKLDWDMFYAAPKPRLTDMPKYPFEKERCWLRASESSLLSAGAGAGAKLHPLLHRNTSDLSEQRYTSDFTGNEFFFADHVVQGRGMLPGAAHMEMVRAAVEQAAKLDSGGAGVLSIRHLAWVRSVAHKEGSLQVHVGLHPQGEHEISFKVYGSLEDAAGENAVFSEGYASLAPLQPPPPLNLDMWHKQHAPVQVSVEECYTAYQSLGIDYGLAHRGLEALYVAGAASRQPQVLAKLALPDSLLSTFDNYILHPCMMDSALHATLALTLAQGGSPSGSAGDGMQLSLPFAVQEVAIYGPCLPQMWAVIRLSEGSSLADKVQKFDMDLCDELGGVRVAVRGFSTRRLLPPQMNLQVTPETPETAETAVHPAGSNHAGEFHVAGSTYEGYAHVLRDAAAKLLEVELEDVDAGSAWIELGLDAVKLEQLSIQLNEQLGQHLSVSQFAEHATIERLALWLGSASQAQAVPASTAVPPSEAASNRDAAASAAVPAGTAFIEGDHRLQEKAERYVMRLISHVLKMSADRMEADAPLEKYGIDSLMVIRLTNELEKVFGSLPKTLFFEYQTIRELTAYFMKQYPKLLADRLEISIGHTSLPAASEPKSPVPSPLTWRSGLKLEAAGAMQPVMKAAEQPVQQPNQQGAMDIAIIGVAGRYPGAKDVQQFWKNLMEGKDCITEIPAGRWNHQPYFDPDKDKFGKTYSKWGGFLDAVDQFDPIFFNISPREAAAMDPQERLFLQCAFETLEDAGYTREALASQTGPAEGGNVGVYVGVMYEEYQLYGVQETALGKPVALPGNPSSVANRVSYFCNFNGPSMAIDTACSSSLTAIYLACQSLMTNGCKMAIAGGVNVSIHPNKYLLLGQGKFVSGKGRCESFGIGGDGYVPGEGVGAVLLKPLANAIADGDHIYGVIKGAAINHGGKTNGYTVPNPNAQAKVIERAIEQSGIHPRTISFIEAHGTGTSLGDPIEIAGLTKAYRHYTDDSQFCAIGSVKSNIGHCESAAGIAGLTKLLMQLKHKLLPPSLHAAELNPNIDFKTTPFIVQQSLEPWKRPVTAEGGASREHPLRAAISGFGAGGSNAHLIIEEFIPAAFPVDDSKRAPEADNGQEIIVFSARSRERLTEVVERMLCHVEASPLAALSDFAYTLQQGREAMDYRLAMVVSSWSELMQGMRAYLASVGGGDVAQLPISMYTANVEDHRTEAVELLGGSAGEAVLRVFIAEHNLDRIALYWTRGGKLDWDRLYPDKRRSRLPLPAYPFAKERYWYTDLGISAGEQPASEPITAAPDQPIRKETEVENFIARFLIRELTLPEDQIRWHKNMQDYGMDSIVSMKLARECEQVFQVEVTVRDIMEHPSIQALASHLNRQLSLSGGLARTRVAEDVVPAEHEVQDDMESLALERFRSGELSYEELEHLLDQGLDMEAGQTAPEEAKPLSMTQEDMTEVGALELFKQGVLSMDELEKIIDKGEWV